MKRLRANAESQLTTIEQASPSIAWELALSDLHNRHLPPEVAKCVWLGMAVNMSSCVDFGRKSLIVLGSENNATGCRNNPSADLIDVSRSTWVTLEHAHKLLVRRVKECNAVPNVRIAR